MRVKKKAWQAEDEGHDKCEEDGKFKGSRGARLALQTHIASVEGIVILVLTAHAALLLGQVARAKSFLATTGAADAEIASAAISRVEAVCHRALRSKVPS